MNCVLFLTKTLGFFLNENQFKLIWEKKGLKHILYVLFLLFQTKVKLQRVRLMAEIFGCDPGMTFQKSTLSQIIMNSKSKECGPLRLHDVNPAASCHQSRTKIFILSFFKLVIILTFLKGHLISKMDALVPGSFGPF